MSKMSELSSVLDELIQTGQNLIHSAEEMKKSGESMVKTASQIRELFNTSEEPKPAEPKSSKTKKAPEPKKTPEPEKTYSFTEVRGALAAKSKEGYKTEVKALLTKYGADKLSAVDPKDYAALMADIGGLTHE